MYQHVLVALDGSALSEAVLPEVRRLVQGHATKVTLVRVVNVPATVVAASGADAGFAGPELIEEAIEGEEDEDKEYLQKVAERLKASGMEVAWEVVEGAPAAAIVDTARRLGCDALAMATHGRTGLRRAVLGSVADQVVRDSHLPVLLVRPPVA